MTPEIELTVKLRFEKVHGTSFNVKFLILTLLSGAVSKGRRFPKDGHQ